MNTESTKNQFSLVQKFFWRFILLFLLLYIVPYDLAFGFTDKFEEWRLWHEPIFWIGENLLGWEFNYDKPLVGWDSKFEVCRYIFILIFGSILGLLWLLFDTFYLKSDYEERLIVLTQTFLRYRIAIVMLHYGLAKVFLHQFGTIDIDALETNIGDYGPMGLMWKYLSYSEELQLFAGWVETVGAFLLFFRKTTFLGAIITLSALVNVVLWDIGYSVSVTLYAIQLLLLTLVLLSNQFKSIYQFLILGKSALASKYKSLIGKTKFNKPAIILKTVLLIGLSILYAQDRIETQRNYFNNKHSWFTGLHTVDTFVINGDTINDSEDSKKWKKIIFNDIIYYNDSFKIEFADNTNEDLRFKYEIDSISRIINYRKFEDEKAVWNELKYLPVDGDTFQFEGIFENDTLSISTKIKRLKDYTLISRKGKWLIDLD